MFASVFIRDIGLQFLCFPCFYVCLVWYKCNDLIEMESVYFSVLVKFLINSVPFYIPMRNESISMQKLFQE